MIIRKLFKYEASHQVFDAYSHRCSHSVHGHSYVVEFNFHGSTPDPADMLLDFGIVKRFFHPFVDSFDHTHMIWDDKRFETSNAFFTENNERWVSFKFNSTAEMQAKMFFSFAYFALKVLKDKYKSTYKVPYDVNVHSVTVHETDTSYAKFELKDISYCTFSNVELRDIVFSEGIKRDWSEEFQEFYKNILDY